MAQVNDPYDPNVERAFKARARVMSAADAPLKSAIEYWQQYIDLYGTPQGQDARALAKVFLRVTSTFLRTVRTLALPGLTGYMDWDEFVRHYQPVPGGEFYEVCTSRALGKDDCLCYGHNTFPRDVPEERVWEIIATTDDDPANTATFIYPYQCRYAINAMEAGMERIGFMVTEQPHNGADIEVRDEA